MSNRETDCSKDRKWLETECDRPLNAGTKL